jgi:hypothetical protein
MAVACAASRSSGPPFSAGRHERLCQPAAPKQPEKPVEKPADKPAPAAGARRFEPAVVSVRRRSRSRADGRASSRSAARATSHAGRGSGGVGRCAAGRPARLGRAEVARASGASDRPRARVPDRRVLAGAHPARSFASHGRRASSAQHCVGAWRTPRPHRARCRHSIDAGSQLSEPVPLVAPRVLERKGFEPDTWLLRVTASIAVALGDRERADQVTPCLRGEECTRRRQAVVGAGHARLRLAGADGHRLLRRRRYGLPMPLDVGFDNRSRQAVRLDTTLAVTRDLGFCIGGGWGSLARMQTTTITGRSTAAATRGGMKRASVTGRFDSYAAANLVGPMAPFEVWAGRSGVVELATATTASRRYLRQVRNWLWVMGPRRHARDLDQPRRRAREARCRGVVQLGRNKGPPKEKLRIPSRQGCTRWRCVLRRALVAYRCDEHGPDRGGALTIGAACCSVLRGSQAPLPRLARPRGSGARH